MDGNAAGNSSYGSEADNVASFVGYMQAGLQEQKVTACIGQFPGIGSSTQSTKDGMASTDRSAEDFRANEFVVFRTCIDNGMTKMIRISNMASSSLTGDNTPCTFSSAVVTDILRNELNFRGVIVSGAMNEAAISNYYGADEAAVLALHRRILRRHTTEYWRLYRTAPFPRNASMIPCGESTVSNMRINWNSKEDRRRLHVSAVVFFLVKNGRSCYLSNKSNISLTNSHIVD